MAEIVWRKARASGPSGNCVEVADAPDGGRFLRDSKDRTGPVLSLTSSQWAAFVDGINNGEFGSPA